MRGGWLLLFALVGVGCASLPPCPHRGGPPWREYATKHFEVRTDLGPADAEQVVRNLEETRATMLATAWGGGDEPRDRTLVIVLASRSALEVFTGGPHVAHSRHLEGGALRHPSLASPAHP